MIGFFLKGDRRSLEKLHNVLDGKYGIRTLAEQKLRQKNFGTGLNLILFVLIAESDLSLAFKDEMVIGGLSKKSKSTRIKIPINKTELHLSRGELHNAIVNHLFSALSLVEKKYAHKVDTDFASLKTNFLEAVALPADLNWETEPEVSHPWD